MSSLVISGDTSGSVTLQAPAVAGTTVLTLPATSGTIVTSASGTAATATNLAGGSNGTIPYQSASGTTQMLAVGTPNQVLQTNGAGAPTWVTPSSGALTLLSTVTASNSATVDIESTFSSTYDAYLLFVVALRPATNSTALQCFLKIGGSYITTNVYHYHSTALLSTSAAYAANANNNASLIQIVTSMTNDSERGLNMQMNLYNPTSTTKRQFIHWAGSDEAEGALGSPGRSFSGAGRVAAAPLGALTGVRFSMSSGNITSGTFRLYGLSNS